MHKKLSPILLGLCFWVAIAQAQVSPRHCGAEFLPQAAFDTITSTPLKSEAVFRQLVTLSVVVHVVWQEEADNISDAQIASQIDALNQDFQKRNANRLRVPEDFAPLVANVGFEFCLASVDPNGQPTDGITRQQTSIDCIGNVGSVRQNGKPRLYYSDLGGVDAWDTEHYINIWVASNCDAYLGLGTFPEGVHPLEDGLVIDPLFFGVRSVDSPSYPYYLGKTTTHEMGHYFNLQHIWGKKGCEFDDGVADTPLQEEEYRDCPIHPISSCGSPDMFMNFMNYVDDECLMFFTKGQKERMWAALNGPRKGLLEAQPCQNTTPQILTPPLSIFPNPARDCIHVILEENSNRQYDLLLLHPSGRQVYSGKISAGEDRSIDVQSLSSGIYFVQVVLEKQVYSAKVLVLSNSL